MHFRSDENRKPEITYVFAGHWNSSECVKLTLLIHFEIFCNLFPKRHLLWGKFFKSSCWSFILRRNVLDKIWLINMVRMKLSSFWETSLLAKRILAWRETTNGNHVGVGGPMRIEWLCVWVMFSTHFDVFCDQQLKTQLFGIKKIKLFPRNILLGYLTLLKRIRQTSFLKRHAMNGCCWKEEDDH